MDWIDLYNNDLKKDYFKKLLEDVKEEYKNYTCFPPYENIFRAYKLTPLEDVKVVILGQDPYHEKGQANGLAFSVDCKKLPPSLKNIYKEMESDLGLTVNQDGDLSYLAKQGVMLLNTTLTVREGEANSHKNLGWSHFTNNSIALLNALSTPKVFILWGNDAKTKKSLITNPNHLIIESAHPSPLSAYHGFFGSKPFSKANEFLKANGRKPIDWVKEENNLFNLK